LRVGDRAAPIQVSARVHHAAVSKTPGRPGEAAIAIEKFGERKLAFEEADPLKETRQTRLRPFERASRTSAPSDRHVSHVEIADEGADELPGSLGVNAHGVGEAPVREPSIPGDELPVDD
jgi:hypothetical protein